jgi:hypothetical protein
VVSLDGEHSAPFSVKKWQEEKVTKNSWWTQNSLWTMHSGRRKSSSNWTDCVFCDMLCSSCALKLQ